MPSPELNSDSAHFFVDEPLQSNTARIDLPSESHEPCQHVRSPATMTSGIYLSGAFNPTVRVNPAMGFNPMSVGAGLNPTP